MRKNPRLAKGFSMVELVFAIAVIATALILFIGVFFSMFRATEKGVDLTAGTIVAETELMKFLAAKQAAGELDSLKKNGELEVPAGTTSEKNRTVFNYEIRSWEVDPVAAPNLRRVEITVWWWGAKENPNRLVGAGQVGYGKLSVVLSRLVYTHSQVVLTP